MSVTTAGEELARDSDIFEVGTFGQDSPLWDFVAYAVWVFSGVFAVGGLVAFLLVHC
jgi:hypothetical protein